MNVPSLWITSLLFNLNYELLKQISEQFLNRWIDFFKKVVILLVIQTEN